MGEVPGGKLRKMIERYHQIHFRGVHPEWGKALWLRGVLDDAEFEWQLRRVQLAIELGGQRVLDIGCGLGGFMSVAQGAAGQIVGIEPDQLAVQIASMRPAGGPLAAGVGEALPFGDASFDRVVMLTVLEHVENTHASLAEAVRVLRRGGELFVWVPNYACLWESHYSMVLPTFLPRAVLKWYLRLRGRRAEYLDHLNFVTVWGLERELARLPVSVRNLGISEWVQAVEGDDSMHSPPALKLFALARRLRLSKVLKVLAKFGIYTPLVYVVTKIED